VALNGVSSPCLGVFFNLVFLDYMSFADGFYKSPFSLFGGWGFNILSGLQVRNREEVSQRQVENCKCPLAH
jgi:hypothetical protein